MAKKKFKLPLGLVFDLIGALIGTLKDTIEAVHPDSEGGGKITIEEKKEIEEALLERFRSVLQKHLAKL